MIIEIQAKDFDSPKNKELIESGNAGLLISGDIVDRREVPYAWPIPVKSKEDIELKRCPFCGGNVRLESSIVIWIRCNTCGLSACWSDYTRADPNYLRHEVVRAWNSRA